MTSRLTSRLSFALLGLALLLLAPGILRAEDSLSWRKEQNLVDADIRNWPLPRLLQTIAVKSGWTIYVEPGAQYSATTKFKNLPAPEALRFLLGDLNFALVPETNGPTRLLVFQTSMQRATQLIEAPVSDDSPQAVLSRIPNELIVRLKPGANIDEIARALGAKVVGRIEGLNAYRLEFEDAAATDAARKALDSNPEVAAVDYNYSIERPQYAQGQTGLPITPLNLKLNPPTGNSQIIIGLVDTPIQKLDGDLNAFLLTGISLAGDAKPDPANPTHATSMVWAMLTSLQSATGGSTSVQILPVDVYGSRSQTSTFEVAQGIIRAVNAGANPINLSLGSPVDSPFLRDVITQSKQQGIVFFAAAGNEPVAAPVYPAAYPDVTSVTSVDRNNHIANFANYSPTVDVGAPPATVFYFGGKPYVTAGTSVSAAYVSGMAAGIADANKKTLSYAQTIILNNLSIKPGTLPR